MASSPDPLVSGGDPPVPNSTIQELTRLAEQSRGIRQRFQPIWMLNLAYFLGDQWVYWNAGRLDRPKLPKHRLLITDNRILPVIQTRVAKKTKQRPIWAVTPNSTDDSDVAAAELAEQIIEDKWKSLQMQERLAEVLYWADLACAGFWKVYWDPSIGESVEVYLDQNGKAAVGQDGRLLRVDPAQRIPNVPTKKIAQGDVCLEVRSPFHILPDPLAHQVEDCEWIIEEVVQSPEWVKQRYGVELQGDTEASPGPVDTRYFPSMQLSGSSSYKGVKVFEFWAKESSKYPQGKRVVWAKDKLLYEGPNPYGCIPYVMFTGAPVPGRFWPTSITEQLRGPQTELNKIKSQIAENAQRLGNPAILKSRLANVEYSGVPGEEILFDDTTQNSIPSYLHPPEMPMYVREQQDRIEQSIREISGQHEVSSSQVPAGVTAASAINLLLEQDDTRLGPAITDMEVQLGKAGKMVLDCVARYYTDERVLRLAGEDGDWDVVSFKGETLRNNTNVEVQAGSAFPASKAAKQAAMQQVLTLFVQNGVPLDGRSLRKFFRDFQVGGLESLFSDMDVDLTQVKRENRMMYQGVALNINSYDDDEQHIAGHQDEMKAARYQRQPPQVKMLFERHVALHQQRLQETQQQDQAQQAQQIAQQAHAQAEPDMQELMVREQYQQYHDDRNARYKLQQIEAQQRQLPKENQ